MNANKINADGKDNVFGSFDNFSILDFTVEGITNAYDTCAIPYYKLDTIESTVLGLE